MIARAVKITLILIMAVGLRVVLADDAQPAVKKNVTVKTLSGEVSGISPNFIAVLYGQDAKSSYEMGLVINKNTKVERKHSLNEIVVGDTVSVKYEETTQVIKEKTQKGEEKDTVKVLSRIAKVVSFIKSPAEGLQSTEEGITVANEEPKEKTAQPEESEEEESQE